MGRQSQLRILVVLGMVLMLSGAFVPPSVVQANSTESVQIGMPFSGQWAYNAHVNPPYSDSNSSHPAVHATPGGGDWSIDLYAPAGTAVRLQVKGATGGLTFAWANSSTSCGSSVRINVYVDNVRIGWVYIAHLKNPVQSGSINNGMVLGYVAGLSCNSGHHVHLEAYNVSQHACYYDHGHPGVTLAEGTAIGLVGANNDRRQQACSQNAGNSTSCSDHTLLNGHSYQGSDSLSVDQSLSRGQYLQSSDGRYVVVMQFDGNLVLYGPSFCPLWSTNTSGQEGELVVLQADGNLVLYRLGGSAIWANNQTGSGTTSVVVQADGNFVAYRGSSPVWSTNTLGRT